MEFFAAMPTCEARREARSSVLQALALHNVHPTLYDCDSEALTPRQRYLSNLERIYEDFAESTEPYLLYVEDDILIAPSFGKMLRRAMLGELEAVTFFNPTRNGYTKEVLRCLDEGQPLAHTFYGVTNQGSWYSSLAMLFSRAGAAEVWKHIDFNDNVALDNAMQKAKVRLYCAVPNPVDHMVIPSATSPNHWAGRIRSISYDGPTA